ncbi:ketopantoate hydroxymethyltransferase [Punctularia strigosozonata HHB-11173 SS5]|uniref:ketopantoate hydroxymethyltransferase n=1 Tax=Punctularia strigosozonata (strain HHB-11173) TaxID=741275 RepID=UPI000441662A|nr:ketopantoate hydroxymethyltransferase [Punctularia strigosozonata HHB-11173 SS5]EIN06610.1 ketopantoate hydroxymethyltransferase [Punctularia strigosozonata HHB-11173 SS5]
MSVRPQEAPSGSSQPRKKVTIAKLHAMKRSKTPITMLTAYDYPTGLACDSYDADITLVGDSLAQVCLGYASTTALTLDEMLHHCRAVARGSKAPLLVADMPFGTYHVSAEDAVRSAVRLLREGSAVEAVKLEGGAELAGTVRRLTEVGIPVMGHVGLQPQRHVALSGYRVQGKEAAAAARVVRDALAVQEAGAFAIVVEAVPWQLAEYVTERLSVPTIGIGAGPRTSGQVLVWDDVMGTWSGHKAKFVRRFADVRSEVKRGVEAYREAVRDRSFPSVEDHSYAMDPGEWERFLEMEAREGRGAQSS